VCGRTSPSFSAGANLPIRAGAVTTQEVSVAHRNVRVASALVLAMTVMSVPTARQVVSAAPPGFERSVVADLGPLTTVRGLADGRVAVLEKGGFSIAGTATVRWLRNGVLQPTVALSLPVCANSERGLLGIAAAPIAPVTTVYLYYTANVSGTCVNRVSRFAVDGDRLVGEQVLLDGIPSTGGNHNGGDLEIGTDGQLYVAVGDAGTDPRGNSGSGGNNDAAQDLSLLNGKILRIDPATGAPSAGNPFAGEAPCNGLGTSAPTDRRCPEIYAWGLRNPYRIALDPNAATTRIFINDVGQNTREEVSELVAGGNYGWPCFEGSFATGRTGCGFGPFVAPLTDYPSGSVTGGAFVPNGAWPLQYDGAYLFGDYLSGEIWVRTVAGAVDYGSPFDEVAGLTDLAMVPEPDGLALYAVTSAAGQVIRILYPDQPVPSPSPPLRYVARAEPDRVLDTREPSGGAARLAGGTVRDVATGVNGVVTQAVLVNITYVEPVARGFLTAWEAGQPRPRTSNINADGGQIVANAAVVPVDAGGRISVFTNVDAHLVIDVLGAFDLAPGPVSAGRYVALTPARLADTREPIDALNRFSRLGSSPLDRVNVPVAGRFGVPDAGVAAVTLTVTGLSSGSAAKGWVNVLAAGTPLRLNSNVNTNGGADIRPNLVVVPLGPDGSVDVWSLNVPQVVVDVTGYITDDSATPLTSGRFRSLAPYREVDTREGRGFVAPAGGDVRTLDPRSVPSNAIGISQNVTLVDNLAPGFVTSYPNDPRPFVSSANLDGVDQVRAAAAFTPLGAGSVRYFFQPPTNAVVDITGYFEG
jgi:glucose/arabinose dehydrogenase